MYKSRFAPARTAAQQGAYAGQQLVGVIGFNDVIIGAGIQPGNAVTDTITRRGNQHRHRAVAAAQGAQHRQPVTLGQAQVQQHQVVFSCAQGLVGHSSIADPVNCIVFGAQQVQYHFANHDIVFNE